MQIGGAAVAKSLELDASLFLDFGACYTLHPVDSCGWRNIGDQMS
jgi:hypothetical protein